MPEPLTYLRADGITTTVPEHLTGGTGPLCSIVIPCHDYGAYLEEAVESALAQTLVSVEVIVVDDGSTDPHTREVATSLIGRPDLKVIFTRNQGVGAARNTGIRTAQGRYICCLDADDVLPRSYVEQCVYVLESHRNVGFAYPWIRQFGRSDSVWKTKDFSIDVAMEQNVVPASAVFRKADWVLAGGYSESLDIQGFEDWEFWLRLGQLGRTGKVIEQELFHRRRHDRSLMDRVMARRETLIRHIRNANDRLFCDPSWVDAILAAARVDDAYRFPADLAAAQRGAARQAGRGVLLVCGGADREEAQTSACAMAEDLSGDHAVTCLTTAPPAHGARAREWDTFHVPEHGPSGGAGAFARYLISSRGIDSVIATGTPWNDVRSAVAGMQPDVTLEDLTCTMTATAPGTACRPEPNVLPTLLHKKQ